MAVKLENKPNVEAPALPFTSFGNIKDETSPGANDGTPVNTEVYQDLHQFFAKMADAVALAYNGLADNDVNGFQYFNALISNIRATAASATQKGTVERATASEVAAGTDTTRYIAPNTLKIELDKKADKTQPSFVSVPADSDANFTFISTLEIRTNDQGITYFKGSVSVEQTAASGAIVSMAIIGSSERPNREIQVTVPSDDAVFPTAAAAKINSSNGEITVLAPGNGNTRVFSFDGISYVKTA